MSDEVSYGSATSALYESSVACDRGITAAKCCLSLFRSVPMLYFVQKTLRP